MSALLSGGRMHRADPGAKRTWCGLLISSHVDGRLQGRGRFTTSELYDCGSCKRYAPHRAARPPAPVDQPAPASLEQRLVASESGVLRAVILPGKDGADAGTVALVLARQARPLFGTTGVYRGDGERWEAKPVAVFTARRRGAR